MSQPHGLIINVPLSQVEVWRNGIIDEFWHIEFFLTKKEYFTAGHPRFPARMTHGAWKQVADKWYEMQNALSEDAK